MYINNAQIQYEKNKQPNRKTDKNHHRHKIQMENKHENTLKLIGKQGNVYKTQEKPFYNHWIGKRSDPELLRIKDQWLLMNTIQGEEVN